MSWDTGANGNGVGWDNSGDTGGFTADTNGGDAWGGPTADDSAFGGRDSGDTRAAADEACRNCGMSGHFSRDCTEPKKQTGECFNCGQMGHNKADCTNPQIDRPFTGICRICDKEGHRAADCPDKPAEICRTCGQEGHKRAECKAARKDVFMNVQEISSEDAWNALKAADKERDIDDAKKAFLQYCLACLIDGNPVDVADLETGFRTEGFNLHLIAKETEENDVRTIISMAGEPGQKYKLVFNWSLKASRKKFNIGYPKTPEINLERLKSCGFPSDSLIPKCGKCGEMGHVRKYCKSEVEGEEITRVEVKCAICHELGHRARDCKEERVDPFACRNCKKSGHNSKECPEPRSAENVTCNKCEKMGHFSRDCPDAPKFACRNCGEEGHRASDCTNEKVVICRNCEKQGHVSRDCPEPKNPATTQCRNCDKIGHFSRDCPEPKDWMKVQCKNCGEMGHTIKRCTKPIDADGDGGAPLNGGFGDGFGGVPVASGGQEWETTGIVDDDGGW